MCKYVRQNVRHSFLVLLFFLLVHCDFNFPPITSVCPLQSSPEMKTDDEMEFTIVREESSPEPEPPQRTSLPPTYPVEEEEEEEEEEDIGDNVS